jgi:hypothetical protein
LQEVKAELEGKTTLLYTRLLEDLTSQVSDAGKPKGGGGPAGSGLESKTTLLYTRLLEDLTSQVSDAGKSEAGGGSARGDPEDLTSLVRKAGDPDESLHIRR